MEDSDKSSGSSRKQGDPKNSDDPYPLVRLHTADSSRIETFSPPL
jgi:hypothetical protein